MSEQDLYSQIPSDTGRFGMEVKIGNRTEGFESKNSTDHF